ncbi:MAG: hypothetical protein GXO54_06235 [Chloroflexi bacterium]|nr:hypothetical protein [Chloroflexota bacterium]
MRKKIIFWGFVFIVSSISGFVLGWIWLSRETLQAPVSAIASLPGGTEIPATDLSFRQLELANMQLRVAEPQGWHFLPLDQGPVFWAWLAVPEPEWAEARWTDETDDLMLDEYEHWWWAVFGEEETGEGEGATPSANPTPDIQTGPPGPGIYLFVGPVDRVPPYERADYWFAFWVERSLWDPDSFRLDMDAITQVPDMPLTTWRLPWSYTLNGRPFEAEMWIMEGGRGQDVVLIAQAPKPLWLQVQQILHVMGAHLQITPRTEGGG